MAENLGTHTPNTPNFDIPEAKEVKIWPYAILFIVVTLLTIVAANAWLY